MSVEYFFGAPHGDVSLRFIKGPIQDRNGLWKWPPLKVKQVEGTTMNGLFAAEDIEPGLLVPYAGLKIARRTANNTDNSYQMEANHGRVIVDANPALNECALQFCVGGFMNEASKDLRKEKYNCKFVELWEENCTLAPQYAHAKHADWPYLLVMSRIPKDKQLFVSYGPTYEENRKHFNYEAKDTDAKESYDNYDVWQDTLKAFQAAADARTEIPVDT